MAKVNTAHLLGYLYSDPTIILDDATRKPLYAHCVVVIVRPKRDAGDNKTYVKLDNPHVMTRDPGIMEEMSGWKANDIVLIKGVVASKAINKSSYCEHCHHKNVTSGALVYVNPIFAKKIDSRDTKEEALEYITACREVSNEVSLYGTLYREPQKLIPREGLVVTQYPILANRKFRVQSDPVNVKTDYIWIKSYGENAVSDREHLHIGSEIIVDGCLQARSVKRNATCEECGQKYAWKDRAMEIVPFAVEYLSNYYTDQEIEQNRLDRAKAKAARARELAGITSTPLEDEDSIEDGTDE